MVALISALYLQVFAYTPIPMLTTIPYMCKVLCQQKLKSMILKTLTDDLREMVFKVKFEFTFQEKMHLCFWLNYYNRVLII